MEDSAPSRLVAALLSEVRTLGILLGDGDADADDAVIGMAAAAPLLNSAFPPVALRTSGYPLELHAVVVCGRLLVHVCMPDGETYSVELGPEATAGAARESAALVVSSVREWVDQQLEPVHRLANLARVPTHIRRNIMVYLPTRDVGRSASVSSVRLHRFSQAARHSGFTRRLVRYLPPRGGGQQWPCGCGPYPPLPCANPTPSPLPHAHTPLPPPFSTHP